MNEKNTCATGGMLRPGAMCGQIIVGGSQSEVQNTECSSQTTGSDGMNDGQNIRVLEGGNRPNLTAHARTADKSP